MRTFPLALMFATLAPAASAEFGSLTSLISTSQRTRAEQVDVDGDGVLDLLTLESTQTQAQFQLSWSKGDGELPFGPSQPIAILDGTVPFITSNGRIADGGDLDGDGFVDLVVATSEGLLRLNGLSGNQFAAPRVIDTTACFHAEMIDLDQDGDLDIVKGAYLDPSQLEANLYLNNGAGLLRPLQLPSECCSTDAPLFTDADQDGDLDMVLLTGSPQIPHYFENLGGLIFAPGVEINLPSSSPFIALGDLDQDGDDDLLYAYFATYPGGWVENVGGAFTTDHVVLDVSITVSAPRVGDVDGDGDIDFVLLQDIGGTRWYPNDGNNEFPVLNLIDNSPTGSNILDLVDIDGDQAVDILFAADGPAGVFAYLNVTSLGEDVCTANANSTGFPASLRASGSRSANTNHFVLTLQDAPAGQLAAFLVGRTTQISSLPGSAGLLCLGAPFAIFRGPGQISQIDGAGALQLPINLAEIPAAGGVQAVQSGETWFFQSIFRDASPLGGSNLSPAIQVTFVL